ncbi:autotransporter outer membrane beta-barrel domain-containing protein [Caulobacter sp. SL161]|uniref:autotransporter outer membrane beta-barrel domain-containing protein n=1 Tax=Caulobacter sp. SL161 TaxID=2995156 RepID=UPI00227703FA|nr:autotransporter outer membrane beta-barrel domain-containing protein [Caulobacter sp. SL161]MCY1647464.1 autotransporter outer membrane beta-barrel domain-containing protein [Caulobacter sp. SL161]
MFRFALSLTLALLATQATAAEAEPRWMVTTTGGAFARDNDQAHSFGSLAVTRKIGRGYVSASVTRFGSAVRQVDVTLPSTYTIGFLSAGAVHGAWFYDGYVSLGRQHYKSVVTDLGERDVAGFSHSPVYGAGGDLGAVRWIGRSWSVTPSASLQWIKSRALRGQIGPRGGSEFETRETGVTLGAGLRVDKFFGASHGDSVSLRLTRFQTTNASAALSSGMRGAFNPSAQSGRTSDAWAEVGASATWRVDHRLYLDVGAVRTLGALGGDMTTGSAGARLLF